LYSFAWARISSTSFGKTDSNSLRVVEFAILTKTANWTLIENKNLRKSVISLWFWTIGKMGRYNTRAVCAGGPAEFATPVFSVFVAVSVVRLMLQPRGVVEVDITTTNKRPQRPPLMTTAAGGRQHHWRWCLMRMRQPS
jgi:hypothetical protein